MYIKQIYNRKHKEIIVFKEKFGGRIILNLVFPFPFKVHFFFFLHNFPPKVRECRAAKVVIKVIATKIPLLLKEQAHTNIYSSI